MGGSSKSSTSQKTQVTDQRVGASAESGLVVATGAGGQSIVTVENISPEVIDAALGQSFGFATDVSNEAGQVTKEALRIIEDVTAREQEPGLGGTKAALLAGVAIVGLAVAAPAIFKAR